MNVPEIGDVVGGKYHLDAILGEGGFGVVFRATTLETERIVAVKVLKHRREGAASVERFRREMRLIAGLQSPYTPTLFDYGTTDDGALYMVTEYIDGQDLSAMLTRRKRLEEEEVRHVLMQVLLSLAEAHAQDVLHRDIKPANIRVYSYRGDSLRVKLLDFGIAKDLNAEGPQLTGTGVVLGTPRYMAPELLVGQPPTRASDLFSVGLVAREMILGPDVAPSRPFEQRFDDLLLARADPASEPFRRIVNRLLAQKPEDRFQSAQEVIDALQGTPGLAPDAAFTVDTRPLDPVDATTNPDWSSTEDSTTSEDSSSTVSTLDELPRTSRRLSGANRARRAWVVPVAGAFGLLVALASLLLFRSASPPIDRSTTPDRDAPSASPPVSGFDNPIEVTAIDHGPNSATAWTPPEPGLHTEGRGGVPWHLYIPKTIAENAPLVVLLRAKGVSSKEFLLGSGFMDVADDEGFAVVAPEDDEDLFSNPWESADDADRVYDVVLAALRSTCSGDRCPTFMVGQAAGARLAQAVSCEDWVDAVAFHGTRDVLVQGRCPHRSSVLWLDPLHSPRLPRNGGSACKNNPLANVFTDAKKSHAEVLKAWFDTMGCEDKALETFREGENVCQKWTCEHPFETCDIDGGDAWPGMPANSANCGSRGGKLAVARRVWEFFERNAQP